MIHWFHITLLFFLPLLPAHPLLGRFSDKGVCSQNGQWFEISQGKKYTLLSDFWNLGNAQEGQQCTYPISVTGDSVSWGTEWNFVGGSEVKSFSSVQLNQDHGINHQLSEIKSMPSTWHWEYSSSSIVADVTYDLFTSSISNGNNEYEVMIWMASFNSNPISFAYDESGNATPIITDIPIGHHRWNLYKGSNGYNYVYSFLCVKDGNTLTLTSFTGDINLFLTYLVDNGYIPSSQYLVTAQAGTEATTCAASGAATFTTTEYSLTVNL